MLNRRFLLDSSAWVRYFMGESDEVGRLIDSEETGLYCSVLSFYEIKKLLDKKRVPEADSASYLEVLRRRCIVVGVSEGLCIKAAKASLQHGLYSVDSLIYCSAVECGATLVTCDSDFRKKKLKNVMIV